MRSTFFDRYAGIARRARDRMFGVSGVVYVRGAERRNLTTVTPLTIPQADETGEALRIISDRRDWIVKAADLAGLIPLKAGDRIESDGDVWEVRQGADFSDASEDEIIVPTQRIKEGSK